MEKTLHFSRLANEVLMTYLYKYEIETYSLIYKASISLQPSAWNEILIISARFLWIILLNWRITVIKIH